MKRPRLSGLASMGSGAVAIAMGLVNVLGSTKPTVVFGFAGIVVGSCLFAMGFGQYRGSKGTAGGH